jgi:DNA-binding NarL/FixJ family response regulator
VLIARCYLVLDDKDTAGLEFDAAGQVFAELGAAPDVANVERLARRPPSRLAFGLTPRELEVLRLVATGKTNHAIAADLVVADKTIDRHVANLFAKLGVSSRAAATAFAYDHRLL